MVKNHYVRQQLLMDEFIWFEGKNNVIVMGDWGKFERKKMKSLRGRNKE